MSMKIASKKPFNVRAAITTLGKTLKRLGFNYVIMYYQKDASKKDLDGSFMVKVDNPNEMATFMISMAAHDANWKAAIEQTYHQINNAVRSQQAKQESQKKG